VTNIFVVSLADSTSRRQAIAMQLKELDLPFEFFDAFDARNMTKEQLAPYYDEAISYRLSGRKLIGAEVGCAMSHLMIYRTIISRDLPYAVVLEDDALPRREFKTFIQGLTPDFLSRIDLVNLFTDSRDLRGPKSATTPFNSGTVYRVLGDFCYNTVAYLITRSGAQKLLKRHLIWNKVIIPADWPLQPREWRFFVHTPFLVEHSDHGDSTIGRRRVGSGYPTTIAARLRAFASRVSGIDYLTHGYAYPSFRTYFSEEVLRRAKQRLLRTAERTRSMINIPSG
jgi:GR25 family glycosyltransferase involved in LPS biosynthesis